MIRHAGNVEEESGWEIDVDVFLGPVLPRLRVLIAQAGADRQRRGNTPAVIKEDGHRSRAELMERVGKGRFRLERVAKEERGCAVAARNVVLPASPW